MTSRRGRGYWLKLATVVALGALAAAYLGWPLVLADRFTHPARAPLNGVTPAEVGLTYQDVRLTASDGVSIAAWYVAGSNGAAIVMAHGILSNRAGVLAVAKMLAGHGYGVLLIDMRAHGESGGDSWSSWLAARDVMAGVDYLKTRPEVKAGRIGVYGFSAGAQTVILAAGASPDIGAVIADAPAWAALKDEPVDAYPPRKLLLFPQDWVYITFINAVYLRGMGMPGSVIDSIGRISPRPLMLIAGGMNPNEVLFANNYLAHAGEPKSLWLIPDAGHGDKWTRHPVEYEQHLVDFFDRWINDR